MQECRTMVSAPLSPALMEPSIAFENILWKGIAAHPATNRSSTTAKAFMVEFPGGFSLYSYLRGTGIPPGGRASDEGSNMCVVAGGVPWQYQCSKHGITNGMETVAVCRDGTT